MAEKDHLVALVEKAIKDKADKASPKEVVEGMFKSALAAALAQKLEGVKKEGGGRIPATYIDRCKRMLISTFQQVEGNFDKSNKYMEWLFNDTMKEILMFSDQQHHKEAKVSRRNINKVLTAHEDFNMTESGIIIPRGTKL